MKYLILCLALVGCTPSEPPTRVDQCMRAEIFKSCMSASPKSSSSLTASGND